MKNILSRFINGTYTHLFVTDGRTDAQTDTQDKFERADPYGLN